MGLLNYVHALMSAMFKEEYGDEKEYEYKGANDDACDCAWREGFLI